MRVGDFALGELKRLLRSEGLDIQFGPFNIRLRSNIDGFASVAQQLYQSYPSPPPTAMVDFHLRIARPHTWLPWRKQASFAVDGRSPFVPCSEEHAFPALEWGINWCVATRAHHLLMLHSAVVEREGRAMLFPAWPGHGKSTLCAALTYSGWRLLSDEFGLVRPLDGMLLPMPRLIPLKNESIDVIARFRPEAVIGPSFFGTRKGTVAHVRPPEESILRAQEPARPRWLVFPRWIADAPLMLTPISKSQAFLMVATNAFNYEILDETAFRLVGAMVAQCDCYSLVYSDLGEAMAALNELAASVHG